MRATFDKHPVASALGVLLLLTPVLALTANRVWAKRAFPEVRFTFTIDPKTPERDLLPTPPKAVLPMRPVLIDDLSQVPEIVLAEPFAPEPGRKNFDKLNDDERNALNDQVMNGKHKTMERTAHVLAKIKHLNRDQDDRFIAVLQAHRPDLRGLPFVVGAACRMSADTRSRFAWSASTVRTSFGKTPEHFWHEFAVQCKAEDGDAPGQPDPKRGLNLGSRIAALTQILGGEPAALQERLVPYLAAQAHADASRALVRLALFAADAPIRQAAVAALARRPKQDYNEPLLQGLRYPWPAVAERAGEALAALKRTDLALHLVDQLEEPDPRAPAVRAIEGQPTSVVREVVRINHHRNCVLCHPPWTAATGRRELTGSVPVPDLPLSFGGGYSGFSPDLLVRADVTYLRPDFSLLQPVADAAPWPAQQRFDFLVRTRTLTAAEVTRIHAALPKPGQPGPYRDAALSALRRLTGADAGTSAEAWRNLLAHRGKVDRALMSILP